MDTEAVDPKAAKNDDDVGEGDAHLAHVEAVDAHVHERESLEEGVVDRVDEGAVGVCEEHGRILEHDLHWFEQRVARDLADYERIHKEWLTAMPHVTKINSAFAMREIVDRTALGLKAQMA